MKDVKIVKIYVSGLHNSLILQQILFIFSTKGYGALDNTFAEISSGVNYDIKRLRYSCLDTY